MLYNSATEYCDWPYNVKCNPNTQQQTQGPVVTNPPAATQPPATQAPWTPAPTHAPWTPAPTHAPWTPAPTQAPNGGENITIFDTIVVKKCFLPVYHKPFKNVIYFCLSNFTEM